MMGARLFCKTGELAGSEFTIENDATIGSGNENAIVLRGQTISRAHARIKLGDGGRYVLEDLDSANGTRLDSRPVKGTEPLSDLHVITFSEHHDFIFLRQAEGAVGRRPDAAPHAPRTAAALPAHEVAPPPVLMTPESQAPEAHDPVTMYQPPSHLVAPDVSQSGAPATAHAGPKATRARPGVIAPPPLPPPSPKTTLAQPGVGAPPSLPAPSGTPPTVVQTPLAGAPDAASHWYLEIEGHSTGDGVSRRLVEGRQVVGRSTDCEVRIDNPTLSRAHVALTLRAGQLTISDLGSANGTFADEVRLKAVQQIDAREGMVLRFGDISATLVRKR